MKMKRSRTRFVKTICLGTCLLASCDMGLITTPYGDPVYALTVQGDTDLCYGLPKSGYYTFGTDFEFRIAEVTNISFHAFINNNEILPSHEQKYKGFLQFDFVMPEQDSILTVTADPFYSDREYQLKELVPWVSSLSRSQLEEVVLESGSQGVDPSKHPPEIQKSRDTRDLDFNYLFLQKALFRKATRLEAEIDGGTYFQVTYIQKDGNEYSLRLSNLFFHWQDFSREQYFCLTNHSSAYSRIEYPMTESAQIRKGKIRG